MLLKSVFTLIAALAVVGTALPAPVPASHVLHEKRGTLRSRWNKGDRIGADAVLPMRIGLTQSNLDNAHEHLMDVSDPNSPNYGKHWTPEEVLEAFKPSDETVDAVRQWLVEAGIAAERITHSDNKGWFAFHATAEEAENLLLTEYHEYEDTVNGGIMPACDQYHLPKHLQAHIDYVTPGVKLVAPVDVLSTDGALEKRSEGLSSRVKLHHPGPPFPCPENKTDLSMCDVAITPACVAALYHIPPAPRHPVKGNSMGIFESELQYYTQFDLNSFFTNFTSYIPNGTHPIDVDIDGGVAVTTNLSLAGEEANLDLMLAYPIVYPQTITLFNVDDLLYQADPNITYTYGFNTLLDALDGSFCTYSAFGETGDDPTRDPIYPDPRPGGYKGRLQCGIYKPTNVISLSYGGQEADVPTYYQKRQCNEYLKLGLQGVSIFFASGDAGVSNYPTADGGTDGPNGCLGPKGNIFNPTWPNTCPWITNVGATKVYPGYTVFDPESAVYDPAGYPYDVNYSSGGGFSNVYAIPAYQASAVSSFFANHDPPYPSYSALITGNNVTGWDVIGKGPFGSNGGIYNRIGRGVPDVAANGDNIAIYSSGNYTLSGGTSASTPIFAAVVNRINEERLRAGKTQVGFINPALYANPSVLNDITNGTNPGCDTLGFEAVEGWDPVTGLGTPNFPKMLEYFMALP